MIIYHVLGLLLLGRAPIDVLVDWVLNATKTESSVENCSAVVLVPLTKSRVLVQLRQYLVQRRHRRRVVASLELFLDLFLRGLIILPHLGHHH